MYIFSLFLFLVTISGLFECFLEATVVFLHIGFDVSNPWRLFLWSVHYTMAKEIIIDCFHIRTVLPFSMRAC